MIIRRISKSLEESQSQTCKSLNNENKKDNKVKPVYPLAMRIRRRTNIMSADASRILPHSFPFDNPTPFRPYDK